LLIFFPHASNESKDLAQPEKKQEKTRKVIQKIGATRRIRTADLLITNQLLYRLS
jgi:hypothetical protein